MSYFVPNKIICNGIKGKNVMSSNFFCKKKLSVIQNGYDTNVFNFEGAILRRNSLCPDIRQNDFLIGFVARWDVHKDIPNLLSALKVVVDSGAQIKCLFVGISLDNENHQLTELIDYAGLSNNIVLLGCRDDISDFMRTIDICVLSSLSEGFPNVLAESMACGTPCITTDVGDSRIIVDETGWIVPHSNHNALAQAIIEAVSEIKDKQQWRQRKIKCRDRIVKNYSIDNMLKNYIELWNS